MPAIADVKRVGVFPAGERECRRRLFDTLEGAFPVRFEPRSPGELRDLDAVLEIGGGLSAESGARAGLAALAMKRHEDRQSGETVKVALSHSLAIDPRLRGASLSDAFLGHRAGLEPFGRPTILASGNTGPLWVRAGKLGTTALAPSELAPGEALRERLQDGRCAALLPLVHFLSDLTRDTRWQPPQPRAAFLFDDPNLHWPSYGFLDLPALAALARERRYHVALAMVPIDGWFAHPTAVRALRQGAGSLSLLVHGNDHSKHELGRPAAAAEGTALAAQALRRVAAFERRTRTRVDRVMAPPHEACSEGAVRGLRRCGFEAISMTRPYPWIESTPRSWLARPQSADALVGWGPGGFVEGLPLLLRHPLAQRSPTELALRAFLGQPLILYGHHEDLLHGPDALLEAAEDVNRLAPARWCSLGEIAATSFETRRQGSHLAVRLLNRRTRIEVPAGVEEVSFELPTSGLRPDLQLLEANGAPLSLGEPLRVGAGEGLEVRLRPHDSVQVDAVPAPRRRPLAVARRLASEGRDRLRPLAARAR